MKTSIREILFLIIEGILLLTGIFGVLLMGNDPINTTVALLDWDGFPEYNLMGLALLAGSVFIGMISGVFDD